MIGRLEKKKAVRVPWGGAVSGGGTGISEWRLPGSAGSSTDRNVGEMSPEARMQDKARVNKERLKGLATMGRHPSRDEIASEDYWERV